VAGQSVLGLNEVVTSVDPELRMPLAMAVVMKEMMAHARDDHEVFSLLHGRKWCQTVGP